MKCKVFGHKFKYNFASVPNKRICENCYHKEKLNLSTLAWNKVDSFDANLGTDEEIIKRWI